MALLGKNTKHTRRRNDGDGRVWYRVCGRPVRARLGEVCSRAECHHRYLLRFGGDQ